MKKLLCVLLLTLTTALSVFALDRETIKNAILEYMTDKNASCISLQITDGKNTGDFYFKPEYIYLNEENKIAFDGSIKFDGEELTDALNYFNLIKISYNKKTGVLYLNYLIKEK